MYEKFPFKETMPTLNVRGRSGGVKEGGGGKDQDKIYLILPLSQAVINSDFKTTHHRYKESEFRPFSNQRFDDYSNRSIEISLLQFHSSSIKIFDKHVL